MIAPTCEITVVIPTRDRWHLLSTAALPSALGQMGVEHEVVVVVDGSRDATVANLAQIDDPRLRVLEHAEPRGVAQARNAGIAAAQGEWVAFLDDDDLWSPHKLRLQLEAAAEARADFAYGGVAWVDEERRFLFALEPPDTGGLAASLLRWNVMWGGCSNVVARRSVVHDVGRFDERLFQLADWDLWIRLALAGPAAVSHELVVGYVMQRQSMLLTDRGDVFREFDYLLRKHAAAAEAHGIAPDGALFARWVALGHLRAGRRRAAASTYLRGAVRHRDPTSAVRALASLTGERGFGLGRAAAATIRRRRSEALLDVDEPAWLRLYR